MKKAPRFIGRMTVGFVVEQYKEIVSFCIQCHLQAMGLPSDLKDQSSRQMGERQET